MPCQPFDLATGTGTVIPGKVGYFIRVFGYRVSGPSNNKITFSCQPIGGGADTVLDGPHWIGANVPLVSAVVDGTEMFDCKNDQGLILTSASATEEGGGITYAYRQYSGQA